MLAQCEDARIQHDVPEHPRARHQGVDTLGLQPFESIASGVRAEVERQHAPHLAEPGRGEEILDDGVAVALDGGAVRGEVEGHAGLTMPSV